MYSKCIVSPWRNVPQPRHARGRGNNEINKHGNRGVSVRGSPARSAPWCDARPSERSFSEREERLRYSCLGVTTWGEPGANLGRHSTLQSGHDVVPGLVSGGTTIQSIAPKCRRDHAQPTARVRHGSTDHRIYSTKCWQANQHCCGPNRPCPHVPRTTHSSSSTDDWR